MHNSTEAEIKRVVLDILDHSKPSTCERCKYSEKCFEGTFRETIHNFEHCGTGPVWDKEAELDRIDRVIAADMLTGWTDRYFKTNSNKEEK